MARLLCALLLWGLAACSGDFRVADLAKSDVDEVAEIHLRASLEYTRQLMEKLYRRNPQEWRRGGAAGAEAAVARVFTAAGPRAQLPELGSRASIDALRLAFEPDYAGDRVLALGAGLAGMLLDAYGGDTEIWLTEELDPQRIYHAARNVEVLVWKLSNDRAPDGSLYLLSNEAQGAVRNLSFERLFGKLIGLQDAMARVLAESGNRRIRFVVRTAASMAFIPL